MNFSTLIVISVTTLLTATAHSQSQVVTQVSQTSYAPEEISARQELIAEVSRIDVSSSTTAHTYKLNSSIAASYQDIDSNPPLPIDITAMINAFIAVPGVTDCTFDNATQTFTIISAPTTNLQVAVDIINN